MDLNIRKPYEIKDTLITLIEFYISDFSTLRELEDWYVPKLETLIADPETSDIIAQLELEIAELQDGLQTESELKNNLKDMLNKIRL